MMSAGRGDQVIRVVETGSEHRMASVRFGRDWRDTRAVKLRHAWCRHAGPGAQ